MTSGKKLSILKSKITAFLEALSDYKLYAPIVTENVPLFGLITNLEEYSFNIASHQNTVKSPKELLFPQTETICRFRVTQKVEVSLEKNGEGETLIFGIRPCDARSFIIFDSIFREDLSDPYYEKNRMKITTIGVACNNPGVNCFCTSVGGGPASKEGLDLLLTDLGDRYIIEVATAKGERLIEQVQQSNPSLITTCSPTDAEKVLKLHKSAEEKILRSMDLKDIPGKLAKLFDNRLWSDISLKCIGCGICTYLCPTCHCFDIQDEIAHVNSTVYELVGRRVRVWDSCMFPEYTLQASGHNPRPIRMNRVRNRIYHKYKWSYDNLKLFACVGCGRCIDSCPVNVDIIDILSKIKVIGD